MDEPLVNNPMPVIQKPVGKIEGGFEVNTTSWCCYKSIVSFTGDFNKNDAIAKAVVICESMKIRPGNIDRNMRRVISLMVIRGVLTKSSRNTWSLNSQN